MLRKFKITIDGKEYLVEMEEIGGTPVAAPVAAPVQEVVAPAPVAPVTEQAAPAPVKTPVGSTENAMTSPMPGTILRILVKDGETVKENQPLMILEAMKMENEVVAGKDGVVAGIHVNQGDTVNAGDPLITID